MQSEIKKGGKNKHYRELAGNGEEHGKNSRSLMWIYSTEWRKLTGAGESRGSPPVFSGRNRLMQRPESVRTRRPAVATATELERKNSGARRKTGGWRLIGPDYL